MPILYRKLTFFMRFRKRIDSFSDFEYKKMGRTFLCIPLLLVITKEDYFFQVTDLQFWKTVSPNDTLLSEIDFTNHSLTTFPTTFSLPLRFKRTK